MPIKDHYKTLQLPPHATIGEIKKAYRNLAQQYHPDKNNDDPYAAAYFAEIKEAYETLTNPSRKEGYLQERWYHKSTGNHSSKEILTPVTILKQVLEFERYCSQLDEFRTNKSALHQQVDELLSYEVMSTLLRFNDEEINNRIVKILCKPLLSLKSTDAAATSANLKQLAGANQHSLDLIQLTLNSVKKKELQQKLKWLWVALITIGICVLMELASRK